MEDSFKVRVDKVFGSLLGSSLPSSSPWTISDAEVERKEWIHGRNRESADRDETPCSSAFDGFFSNEKGRSSGLQPQARKRFDDDLDDLDDDGDDDGAEDAGGKDRTFENGRDGDGERDEWEVRNSIGLDSTLDNEEEEDEYDKVAVGREKAGDRVFMRDATDYGCYDLHNILPDSFEEIKSVGKDPRANYMAAKARLQEDNAEANKNYFSHLVQSDEDAGGGAVKSMFEDDDSEADKNVCTFVGQVKAGEDGGNVKSILKRKDNQVDMRSKKRVRFNTGCKGYEQDKEHADDFMMVTQSMEEAATVEETSNTASEDAPRVPDYIQNPSRYTCYEFDTSEEYADASNLLAFQEFRNMVESSAGHEEPQTETDHAVESLPTCIAFTPRKKMSDTAGIGNCYKSKYSHGNNACKEPLRKGSLPLGIAAGNDQSGEVCAMDEDDVETSKVEVATGFRKVDRQYRSKVSVNESTS
ncbi:hypothetical protein ACLOJK_002236 [Asimina triloba]